MERQHLRLPEDHGGKIFRTSHRRCSLNKGGFKNFEKFTEKHLRQSLFFNKAEGLACKKKRQVFYCEFYKMFKSTFFTGDLRATASEYYDFCSWQCNWKDIRRMIRPYLVDFVFSVNVRTEKIVVHLSIFFNFSVFIYIVFMFWSFAFQKYTSVFFFTFQKRL